MHHGAEAAGRLISVGGPPPSSPCKKIAPPWLHTHYLQQPPGLPYLRPPLLVVLSCEVVRTSV
jgi:hypothetical protein